MPWKLVAEPVMWLPDRSTPTFWRETTIALLAPLITLSMTVMSVEARIRHGVDGSSDVLLSKVTDSIGATAQPTSYAKLTVLVDVLWSTTALLKVNRWFARPHLFSRRQLWSTLVRNRPSLVASIPRALCRIRLWSIRYRSGQG